MSELAGPPRLLKPAGAKHVGFEGAFRTKIAGRYHLICAEFNGTGRARTYDCMGTSIRSGLKSALPGMGLRAQPMADLPA